MNIPYEAWVAIAVVSTFLAGVAGSQWWRWHRAACRLAEAALELKDRVRPGSFIFEGPVEVGRGMDALQTLDARLQAHAVEAHEKEFNLRAILGTMIEGVIVVDSEHTIRLANAEFQEIFRLAQNPLRRTVLESLREVAIQALVVETLRTGEPQARHIRIGQSGATEKAREIEARAVPIRNTAGVIHGAVVVFQDVSRLRELEGVRREFVANVSHELRTPLSIFRGYLETLIDVPDLPPAEVRRIYGVMERHSDRLNALAEDLLTISGLESRRIRLEPVTLRLPAFLERLVADYQTKLRNRETVEIVTTLGEGAQELEADAHRIEQVLLNLLDNAVAYSRPPKRIELIAEREGEQLRLSVRDQGIGIPPADLPHIFERFYRVDKGREREQGGTGLGLSIVKHIVQLHGGSVRAESEYGKGTNITLILPQYQTAGETHDV